MYFSVFIILLSIKSYKCVNFSSLESGSGTGSRPKLRIADPQHWSPLNNTLSMGYPHQKLKHDFLCKTASFSHFSL
jgi:hypothetical protein